MSSGAEQAIGHLFEMRDVDTPVAILDLDVLEKNIESMAQLAREADVALRPHMKTHKITSLAWQQMRAGACGLTCQKIGEAEVMIEAGIDDVLLATPVVGPVKIRRFLEIHRRARVTTVVDCLEAAAALGRAAEASGARVEALLEVDTGLHRFGVSPKEAPRMAHVLAKELVGIHFAGLISYDGQLYDLIGAEDVDREAYRAYSLLVDTADRVRSEGTPVMTVSVGGTSGGRMVSKCRGVTEYRPGNYIFNDLYQVGMGWAQVPQCALRVLSTVVSAPSADRAVVDAGAKLLSPATVPGRLGYGMLLGHEDSRLEVLTDEHGIVTVPSTARRFSVGELVWIVPNSNSAVMNLVDQVVAVRDGVVQCVLPVAARGRVQ